MTKLVLIRPSIDYDETPQNLKKFFPPPGGNYYKEPPMGILYVAASCLKADIKTKIVDQYSRNMTNEEVLRIINRQKPDFVGFSLTSFTLKNSKELARMIKEKNKNCRIVVGGPWVTMRGKEILENEEFDFGIYGEGEITLPELIENYRNRKKLDEIKGLIFRDKNKIILNEPRPFIEDLDSVPYPAYQIVNMDDYARGRSIYVDREPVDYICATRGCPYACAFCSSKEIWKRKYRMRNPVKVVDEMEYMMKKFKTKGFHFRDDNLTVNRRFVLELCEELKKRKLPIKWMCESRVDTLDEEIIEKMKESGCSGMWFGIESGSQKVLDYLNKGIALNRIRKTIKLCQEYGLRVGGSFMLGVPIETRETIKKTVDFAKSLKLTNTWFNQFIGIPDCEIYEEIKKKKLYKCSFNGMLIVETPQFSGDEIFEIIRKNNFYFEVKRLGLILETHSPSEYPKMALYALRSLLSFFK